MNKPLPSSVESEKLIVGAIFWTNELVGEAIEILEPKDFYSPTYRRIFQAEVALFQRGERIEPILVYEELKVTGDEQRIGGLAVITDTMIGIPRFSTIKQYLEIVKDKSLTRQLIGICNQTTSTALSEEETIQEILDKHEQGIYELRTNTTAQGFSSLQELTPKSIERIQANVQAGRKVLGVETGFQDLDYFTSGLQKTDLIIVAARPSMGKTAICLNIAQNAAKIANELVVAVFSLEMSKEQIIDRMVASEAKIDSMRYREGKLTRSEWGAAAEAVDRMSNRKIFIDDTPSISPLELRAKARKLRAEKKRLDLIIVDYMQLMSGSKATASREQEISSISRELKAVAKDLKVPLIALSQLNRANEARANKKPMLSDLRESGSIEQDSDVVIFLHREEYYHRTEENAGLAEMIIAKNRNGGTGTCKLAFLNYAARFDSAYLSGE